MQGLALNATDEIAQQIAAVQAATDLPTAATELSRQSGSLGDLVRRFLAEVRTA